MKLYLETSVPNFLFAEDAPEKMQITKKFFNSEVGKHKCHISDLVIGEFDRAPEDKRDKLKATVSKYGLRLLKTTDECKELGRKYVRAGIIPKKYQPDALHISIAVVNRMDVIVSWNMQHIVKLKTIVGVNKINKKLDYPEILINTPEEVTE